MNGSPLIIKCGSESENRLYFPVCFTISYSNWIASRISGRLEFLVWIPMELLRWMNSRVGCLVLFSPFFRFDLLGLLGTGRARLDLLSSPLVLYDFLKESY